MRRRRFNFDTITSFRPRTNTSKDSTLLKEEAIIGVIPARSGFEYAALKILKDNKKEKVKIFGMQTLPWACRIKEYATKVDILGKKRSVGMAAFPHKITPEL